jgi:GTPase SAR1 family protein
MKLCITNVSLFANLRVTELNEKAPADIVLTLVGNKIDLENR